MRAIPITRMMIGAKSRDVAKKRRENQAIFDKWNGKILNEPIGNFIGMTPDGIEIFSKK